MEKQADKSDKNVVDELENFAEEDTTKNKYLSFMVGNEEFGIEIFCVKEIINIVSITQVPSSPSYVKGIINLRGDIIPVMDVRARFRMEERPYDDVTCIIVVEQKGDNIGLIVDSVNEVKYIKESNISSPPSAKLSFSNQFVKSLGRSDDRVVLLVETDKLLYDEEK